VLPSPSYVPTVSLRHYIERGYAGERNELRMARVEQIARAGYKV